MKDLEQIRVDVDGDEDLASGDISEGGGDSVTKGSAVKVKEAKIISPLRPGEVKIAGRNDKKNEELLGFVIRPALLMEYSLYCVFPVCF